VAKGLTPDEPKLEQALMDQCYEMHELGHVLDPDAGTRPDGPLPAERGFFHERVRPILEKTCSGCHSETSPEGRLTLGGHVSSAAIPESVRARGARRAQQRSVNQSRVPWWPRRFRHRTAALGQRACVLHQVRRTFGDRRQ
jgi:hypothetical protein